MFFLRFYISFFFFYKFDVLSVYTVPKVQTHELFHIIHTFLEFRWGNLELHKFKQSHNIKAVLGLTHAKTSRTCEVGTFVMSLKPFMKDH